MLPEEIVNQLPEDMRNSSAVQKYNDLPSLIKGYSEIESYRGRSIAIPGENDTPELVEKWKADNMPKLGKIFADRLPPDKPDDYEFKFEGVDNEALKSDKLMGVFKQNAHKLGLSKSQAAGLADVFAKEILPSLIPKPPDVNFVDKAEDVKGIMEEIFKTETNQRIDEYKKGVNILSETIPGLKDFLNEGVAPYGQRYVAAGDHPVLVQLITEIGRLTQSDFSGPVAKSEAAKDAATEIEDIMHNKNNPKHDLWRKGDKDTRAYMEELWKATTGGR